MVTWHLTTKLLTAKYHEWATLRKIWCQTGNSSRLPAKCWPHVNKACSWRWPDVVVGISACFSKFAFVLFCYITNRHSMTCPSGSSEFCFPRISVFLSTSFWEHWDSRDTNVNCSPQDQSLKVPYAELSSLTHWARDSRKQIQSYALTLKLLFLTHLRFLAPLVKFLHNKLYFMK